MSFVNYIVLHSRLMVFKARWPDRVTLLRGNHESRQITQVIENSILLRSWYNDYCQIVRYMGSMMSVRTSMVIVMCGDIAVKCLTC